MQSVKILENGPEVRYTMSTNMSITTVTDGDSISGKKNITSSP